MDEPRITGSYPSPAARASPTRDELGDVEVVVRSSAACTPASRARRRRLLAVELAVAVRRLALTARRRLVQARGHRAVGQAHVAQQTLGVVAQRRGQLAHVARDLRPVAED